MSGKLSFLADIDRLCGQFATALHNAEWQVYATLAILILLSALFISAQGRSGSDLNAGGTGAAVAEFTDRRLQRGATSMLSLVVTLLIIALVAAVLGFGGIAGAAVGIAKVVFLVALFLFVLSLIAGGMRSGFGRRV